MKRLSRSIAPFLFISLVCGTTSLPAQNIAQSTAPGSSHAPAHTQRVMAPPLETRTAPRLRPSTAEAGASRSAKLPLQTLPSFSAVGQDAKPQTTASLGHTGHWLLLYRTEHCVPCDRLMNVLAASNSPDLRAGVPYTIIVGAKTLSAVGAVRANYATLGSANWLADPDRNVFTALQLKGAPEVIAMDGDRVAWKVSGNLGDPRQVLQLADSWVAGTAAADAAAKEKAAAMAKTATTSAPATSVKR